MQSKNSVLLKDFVQFCEEHPDQRFYQALRNWMQVPFLLVGQLGYEEEIKKIQDTFYWEGKNE